VGIDHFLVFDGFLSIELLSESLKTLRPPGRPESLKILLSRGIQVDRSHRGGQLLQRRKA